MNATTRLLTVFAATLSSGSVLAAAHERDAFIKQYDANHDGKVERAEFDAARTARFTATDNDSNGALEEGEYLVEYVAQLDAELATSNELEAEKTATRQRQLRQTLVRFKVLDADKNQQITKTEYDASGARSFTNHDTDKDQAVTINDAPNERDARQATTN